MLTRQGIAAREPAVAPVLAVVLVLLCALWPAPLRAWPQGGVPQAVWQDSERNNRRSPSQIKRQLRPPQVRAAQLPLADDAQDRRAAKTRGLIAANAAPLAAPPAAGDQLPMLEQGDWRLKVAPAAVTNTDSVLLGDIAAPLGHMDPALWSDLKSRQLWPAPPEEGKPLQINRSRLSQALRQSLGNELAARCILPTSLVIQRGGLVFREDDLRSYVVKSLTPQLSAMPGEAELNEFRLPDYIFLAHNQQRVQLEPGKLTPGRVPLRFAVQEADGTVLRRVSGTVNLTLWITVPAASRPLGKGDALTPEAVTFMRINAGQLRDLPWDGHGGPWQVTRSLITGEPILQSDLVSQLMVRRGTILTLIYVRGNLRMTTQAEALADGEPGATIPVRNLQTKKQIYATVKDGSTVEIH
ncbi:flagellar basal body P-ring formation chaperone FlgA [Desulfovibrio sp.]|uniref:flagellar basal body P-ring formation chaperone FlgA n=1 Tax=Desulfovibrio sp. TaxID=885 RepID=UPI0025BE92B5|nr:flagellar basal body P-ring formation chaperone FlgA [Desulfovibrio sp.]